MGDMAGRAWAIKLGSGGRVIPFCERHAIIGIGWQMIDLAVVVRGSRDELVGHVREQCDWYKTNREVGGAVGNLSRFIRECKPGDYVLYYDPPNKHVVITRAVSEALFRDFEMDDPIDVWHYRRVEYPVQPISILDFHGSIKGGVLGPRGTFWSLDRSYVAIDHLAHGRDPGTEVAPDAEVTEAYERLRSLVVTRAQALHDHDWEWLVVDYLKAQGAQVDERAVGGSRPIIDVEARFDHGELPEEVWRVQVKRYQDKPVDWPAIERDASHVGEARFCYVSVFGFTAQARERAAAEEIVLLEAGDFIRFLLGSKLRPDLRAKLRLPLGMASEG
jgi:predicted Mrr-cat superfamily restriction endonuclease